MEFVAFVVLAILAIASAVVVVVHRNPVISAVALAFNLVSIAGFYLLLNAQFVALLLHLRKHFDQPRDCILQSLDIVTI